VTNAAAALPILEAEARERQRALAGTRPNVKTQTATLVPIGAKVPVRAQRGLALSRAERKAGEALAEMEKAPPGRVPDIGSHREPISRPPRLDDLGITRKQSMYWQTEATVPEPEFERWVDERKDDGAAATAGRLRCPFG